MTTWTSTDKNTSTFTNSDRSDIRYLITTDTLDRVLVGENEDEILIWSGPILWSNITKN